MSFCRQYWTNSIFAAFILYYPLCTTLHSAPEFALGLRLTRIIIQFQSSCKAKLYKKSPVTWHWLLHNRVISTVPLSQNTNVHRPGLTRTTTSKINVINIIIRATVVRSTDYSRQCKTISKLKTESYKQHHTATIGICATVLMQVNAQIPQPHMQTAQSDNELGAINCKPATNCRLTVYRWRHMSMTNNHKNGKLKSVQKIPDRAVTSNHSSKARHLNSTSEAERNGGHPQR